MVRRDLRHVQRTARALAPPAAWVAVAIVAAEWMLALIGVPSLGMAAAALLAPGLVFTGLLPEPLRQHQVARLAVAPTLGLALSAVTLVSIARLGIALTPESVRIALAALVLAGFVFAVRTADSGAKRPQTLDSEEPPSTPPPADHGESGQRRMLRVGVELLAPVAIAAVALVLGMRVAGTLPVPGDDWAKYLLYADEIRRQGALLLQNPLWMGGRPFSEDPGMGAIEGSALILSGAPAGALIHTILLLGVMQVLAVYGVARAHFGLAGAIVTATLLAVVPATQNMFGWHGLANAAALALMALILGYLGAWLAGRLDRRAEVGLALLLVAVAAMHRLSAAITIGVVGAVLLAALVAGPRGPLLRSAARTAALCIPFGLLVYLDLRVRAQQGGGTQPYTAYLITKVDLGLALRDLSPVLVGTAAVSFLALSARRRFPREVWPAAGLMAVCLVLSYAWVLHLPLYYARTVFYMPLALAPIAGAAAAALVPWFARRRQWIPVAAAVASCTVGAMTVVAWRQAEQVRTFYAFATPGALQGLDALSTQLRPGEIVVTDRCWSFLATWLLHTRTYPALETQDIQPMAELRVARTADAILRGTAAGDAAAQRLGVRYALVDPACPVSRDPYYPPGTPVFASTRLVIIELAPGAAMTGRIEAYKQRRRERAARAAAG